MSKTRTVNRKFTMIWRILCLGGAAFFGWINFSNHHYTEGAIVVILFAGSFFATLLWNRKAS